MSIETKLYDLWTAKAMEQAAIFESEQPHAVRATSRTIYRAYQDGLKALYTSDHIPELKCRLRRRLGNPFRASRHATYVAMLHHIATLKDGDASKEVVGR